MAAAAAAAIGDGIAIVGPAALPPVFNLYCPRNPRLCLALEPPRHDCIVFKAASSIDPYQRWEKVLLGDGSFELVNRHSGCSITIAHILPLVSFFFFVSMSPFFFGSFAILLPCV